MHSPLFDPGIEKAIRISMQAHAEQTRKGTDVPYASHPVHVAVILLRLGCSSQVVQAALLHDVVEDCEDWTLERMARSFPQTVVRWVGELTETKGQPWEIRKQQAVDKVPAMSCEAATIKGADKLHNLQTLVHALESAQDPDAVWSHFHGSPERTLALSEDLVAALADRIPEPLVAALRATLEQLRQFCPTR